jgi:hypothetical protein
VKEELHAIDILEQPVGFFFARRQLKQRVLPFPSSGQTFY